MHKMKTVLILIGMIISFFLRVIAISLKASKKPYFNKETNEFINKSKEKSILYNRASIIVAIVTFALFLFWQTKKDLQQKSVESNNPLSLKLQ